MKTVAGKGTVSAIKPRRPRAVKIRSKEKLFKPTRKGFYQTIAGLILSVIVLFLIARYS